jgi:hypothetical protein
MTAVSNAEARRPLLDIAGVAEYLAIQVTADRYGHLFPPLEEALTERLDAAHRAAMPRLS